eukprot:SM000705S21502  [mRNA]  locus=s705:713:1283:+ [translate_table: standard]
MHAAFPLIWISQRACGWGAKPRLPAANSRRRRPQLQRVYRPDVDGEAEEVKEQAAEIVRDAKGEMPQGPPFLTILAGIFVLILVLWVLVSVVRGVAGLLLG